MIASHIYQITKKGSGDLSPQMQIDVHENVEKLELYHILLTGIQIGTTAWENNCDSHYPVKMCITFSPAIPFLGPYCGKVRHTCTSTRMLMWQQAYNCTQLETTQGFIYTVE